MDFVAVAKDERSHLWIPETGLVAEMNTGFQHFTHGNGHNKSPGLGLEFAQELFMSTLSGRIRDFC